LEVRKQDEQPGFPRLPHLILPSNGQTFIHCHIPGFEMMHDFSICQQGLSSSLSFKQPFIYARIADFLRAIGMFAFGEENLMRHQ
jgi:hypothetical protein